MKMRITVLFFIVSSFMIANEDPVDTTNLVLLDQIEVVVFGQEDVEIITKSDIDRPALGGGFRSKDEIVFEKEIYLDAKKHKVPQDEEAVDAYLAQIQREHNLSEKELETIFTSAGYTIEEGREQLQIMQTVNTMLDVKIRSNLIIPRKDVEKYYEEHPTVIEATYTLERMFVPQSKRMSPEEQYDILVKFARTGKGAKNLNLVWGEPFTINHSDVAESKQFIYTMKVGEVSLPEGIKDGFELFRLVAKTEERLKSLEECYRDIVDILRRPKYEELMENYRQFLLDHSSVIYF
jgi:hypothetical protein